MRKLTLDSLPDTWPITQADLDGVRGINAIEKFRHTKPPADFEMGLIGFSRKPPKNMPELRESRRRIQETLRTRNYVGEEKILTPEEAMQATGLDLRRFTDLHFRAREGTNFLSGVPYAFHWGNIEAQHGILFVEMIRRALQRGVCRVLNMGCGPVGFQQINIEALGVEDIVYADKEADGPFLGDLRGYVEQFGRQGVRRKFVSIDKHDAQRIKSTFTPQSIGAVIRTGVGAAMPQEMEGLRHLMAPDAEMFVSNSFRGQPVEPFLQYMEETFQEIAIAIGLERYAVVCGKPKST